MRTFQRIPPDATTAFRLSREMLEKLNAICDVLDCNRSQLVRRALKEFIGMHELDHQIEGEK